MHIEKDASLNDIAVFSFFLSLWSGAAATIITFNEQKVSADKKK